MSSSNKAIERGLDILEKGIVYCHSCGKTKKVDSGFCLRKGWPKCCDQMMSLDHPKEVGIKIKVKPIGPLPTRLYEEAWMIKYRVKKDCVDYGKRKWGFIREIFDSFKEAEDARKKHLERRTLKVVPVRFIEKEKLQNE